MLSLEKRSDPRFIAEGPGFDLELPEASEDVTFALQRDYTFGYLNPAWFIFARANGAAPLFVSDSLIGRSIFTFLPTVISPFYLRLYERVHNTGRAAEHVYDCSTPVLFQSFAMRVSALSGGRGWLCSNRLLERRSMQTLEDVAAADYLNEYGLFEQCAHCRRVRSFKAENRWDMIGKWLAAAPANITHTLCPLCLPYYEIDDE